MPRRLPLSVLDARPKKPVLLNQVSINQGEQGHPKADNPGNLLRNSNFPCKLLWGGDPEEQAYEIHQIRRTARRSKEAGDSQSNKDRKEWILREDKL